MRDRIDAARVEFPLHEYINSQIQGVPCGIRPADASTSIEPKAPRTLKEELQLAAADRERFGSRRVEQRASHGSMIKENRRRTSDDGISSQQAKRVLYSLFQEQETRPL